MAQKLPIGLLGLSTNSNSNKVPDGSLSNCSNINVDRNLAFGRRGFTKHSAKSNLVKLTEYQDKIIGHSSTDVLSYYSGGSWTDYSGTITPPSTSQRLNFLQASQNLYLTTSDGIKVLDAYNGTIYATGMPRGLDGTASVMEAGTFTANTNDVLTKVGHGYFTGLLVTVSSTVSLPSGLSAATNYYVIKIDSDTFYLATSYANALVGTRIDITSTGSGTHTVTPTGSASGFMANNSQVAYRVVWGTRDANNNLYLGAPSQRIIVSNSSGGTRDVTLTFTLPSGITTSDFFQVYRSRTSAASTTEADDELQLVYEANPTAGEITAKSITFTDSCPTTLAGAYLYTNANQEGISESNDVPPWALDIAEFKGFTFFGNIKTKHYLNLSLLAVSGSGLVANDTITVNGMVFTAKAATTIASREFKVFTAGSASQNVEDTARELIKVINQYSSNTSIYAYYESGYGDLPGQILLEERTRSDSAFTVTVSRALAWSIDNDGTSQNSEYQNGLMWSKAQQPEHAPAAHLEFVGSKSYPIKRILALKEGLFILKDDGVFRLTGANGSWSIETLDSSTSIISPDSAVVINNQIYCLSNQGVVTISDVGVQVIGEDIKDKIQELIGLDYEALQNLSFGIGYETDRKYILSVITNAADLLTTQQFVYNAFTNKWGRWERDFTYGFVAPSNDKLYFADDAQLLEERKTFTYADYIDEEFGSYSVVSSSGTSVVLNDVTGLTIGDLLYESESVASQILDIDVPTNTVTVNQSLTWAVAAVTVYKGIDCSIEWTPAYCDNAGLEKFFQQVDILFKQKSFVSGTMDFYTEKNGAWESVEINGTSSSGLWGVGGWGVGPWGGNSRPNPSRVSVPRNKARGQLLGIRFSCRMAYAQFSIEGLSLQFEYVSERLGARTSG